MGFIGLLRILIFLLALWLIYRFFFQRKSKQLQHDTSAANDAAMVKCAHCDTHLPREEAVAGDQGVWFCSADHQQDYQQGKPEE